MVAPILSHEPGCVVPTLNVPTLFFCKNGVGITILSPTPFEEQT